MTVKIEKREDGWYAGDFGPLKTRASARLAKQNAGAAQATNVKTQSAKAPKKTGRKGKGLVAAIRECFEAGHVTVASVMDEFAARQADNRPSENTIKTQVGRLRREAGLSAAWRSTGPIALIRSAFDAGHTTVAEVVKHLESQGQNDASPATIKTQVGKLRREAGLTKKAA